MWPFKKKINLEKITENDLEKMKPKKLYEIALALDPNNKEKIDQAYNFLVEYGAYAGIRANFIDHHIMPYVRK
jgi:hypothetical protein